MNLGSVYNHRTVVKRRFGEKYTFDKRGRNLGIDDNAAVDYRLGHIAVCKNYYRADVVFRHILNSLDDFVDIPVYVLRHSVVFYHVLHFGSLFRTHIPDISFYLRCKKNEHDNDERR